MQFWTEHVKQYRDRPLGSRPMECTTHPGDVIFVPHVSGLCDKTTILSVCWFGVLENQNSFFWTSFLPSFLSFSFLDLDQGWWHSVINLDDLNIAITHNYLSPSNLSNALKFFVEKQDQISGCRDRAESIKPEHMHDALVQVLMEKEPQYLEQALAQTEWTCQAWTTTADKNVGRGTIAMSKRKRRQQSTNCPSAGAMNRVSIMEKTERVESFTFSFL
jgi:hypothetical protein